MDKYKQEYGAIMNLFNNFDFIYRNTNHYIIDSKPQIDFSNLSFL